MAKGIHDERYRALIGELIRLRKAKGVSQVELAGRLAKRQQFVSKYEGGERRLDVVELLDILEALDLDWREILRPYTKAPGEGARD